MSIDAFFRQRAVNVVVDGSYVLPNWYDQYGRLRNFACRTRRVSPFRMMVDVPVVGRAGDTVSSYFADFGKLTGRIVDTVAGAFLMDISMTPEKRGWMSDHLTWLEARQKDPDIKDARGAARFVPAVPHSTVTLADGRVHRCFVIDVSVTGAAVSSDTQPGVGTPLAIGACVGRVVRTLPHGFAVQFVEPQTRSDLERLIARRGPGFRGEAPQDVSGEDSLPVGASPSTASFAEAANFIEI
jgi:hypothetical protein